MTQLTKLADELMPLLLKRLGSQAGGGGGGGALSVHSLNGTYHKGTLDRIQAPWVATDIAAAIGAHKTDLNAHSELNALGIRSTFNLESATTTSDDGDSVHTLGRTTLGYVGFTDYAGFAHRDLASSVGYALVQHSTGSTYLNAAAAQNIYLSIGNMNRLLYDSNAALRTDNYASQTTGWAITRAGAADFRYMFVDEMHAKSFVADLEQALAGGQIISKSVAVLAEQFIAPAAGGTATLKVLDLPSAPSMRVFVDGDHIRVRKFSRSGGSLSIADCWGTVAYNYRTPEGWQSYVLFRSTGANAGSMTASTTVEPDAIILDYGTSGNGFYEVNAIDGYYAANSPYSQVVTWATHPATGQTVRVRLGNLTGLGFSGEYGLYARGAASTEYLKATGNGVTLQNIDLSLVSGATTIVEVTKTGGMDIREDVYNSWDTMRAVAWWPNLASKTGNPSLIVRTGKDTSGGFTNNQNFAEVRSYPTGNVAADLSLAAVGQGTGATAIVDIQGGSQAASFNSAITLTGYYVVSNGTLQAAAQSYAWTTAGWGVALEQSQGDLILWRKGATGYARGIGVSTNGVLYVGRSTANDASAAATYDMVVDTAGQVGVGTSPSISDGIGLDVNGKLLRLRTAKTPTGGGTGNVGEICWDGSYLYVCVAANTWKRAALAAF